MSKGISKNDNAWECLFDKYSITSNIEKSGFYYINSEQINEFREARLMTKFDHRSNLPKLFKDNGLAILPVTRGRYVISQMEAYHSFEQISSDIHTIQFPEYIQSIDFENITSESTAINTAYVSGMLADFVEDEELLPTVNGRMSSRQFSFNIDRFQVGDKLTVNVDNSQIEIDGGYEGLRFLSLIEAKNSISDDFLIRQIYYPYRLWKERVTKEIRMLFLTYSNGVFSFYDYGFEDEYSYNSLILKKQKNYSLQGEEIEFGDIEYIISNMNLLDEPEGIPFPQADSFKRVISLCEILYENTELAKEEITYRYDFDSRQTNYYTDAARYLKLISKKRENGLVKYSLTELGNSLFRMNIKTRNLKFAELILGHKPFRLTLEKYLDIYEMPAKHEVVDYMKSSSLYNVGAESTFFRRASTVTGWVTWVLDLIR